MDPQLVETLLNVAGFLNDWVRVTWEVIYLSAPSLLFGFLLAGVIHVLLPNALIKKHLKEPGFKSVVKASLIGVPLPLCSCSVIPVAVSLRRDGASRGATASFMVSTPEIGVDSFILSYSLLGPLIAVTRMVAAFISAMFAGALINIFDARDEKMLTATVAHGPHACCAHENKSSSSVAERIKQILRYGFVEVVDDLAVVLTIGILLAGLIGVLVPEDFFLNWGVGRYGSMLIALLVGLPLYVCATSTTPLAAMLVAKGFDPGAAVVFLLAGPASNITTMLAISRELGTRALAFYIGAITVVSLFVGILVDVLIARALFEFKPLLTGGHVHTSNASFFAALAVSVLLAISLARKPVTSEEHCEG